MDGLVAELRRQYVNIADLVKFGVTSEGCIKLECESRKDRDLLHEHLMRIRWQKVPRTVGRRR